MSSTDYAAQNLRDALAAYSELYERYKTEGDVLRAERDEAIEEAKMFFGMYVAKNDELIALKAKFEIALAKATAWRLRWMKDSLRWMKENNLDTAGEEEGNLDGIC